MSRTRTLALVVLMLSYGAVGARQPAVRTSVPLGVPVVRLAATLGIPDPDRSRILLDVVRIVFDAPDGQEAADAALRLHLRDLFRATNAADLRETVPLPLDPSVWRDTILRRQVADNQLIAAILSDRSTALLYHGLAALDDETLAALGPDRETLDDLRLHAGVFATFGRSLRIHAGRIVVPGGPEAEPLWQELVGVEPARPAPFVRRLFAGDSGRLAFFFDALTHLDLPHQRFATGRQLPEASRLERMRALLDVFDRTAPEWRPDDRPFMRPPFDPAITLSTIGLTPAGTLVAPFHRRLWTHIFRGDEATDPPFVPVTAADLSDDDDPAPVDAAWIVSRVHRSPPAIGRRRLDTLLFAQRTLAGIADDDVGVASALRGFIAFPALGLALERIGVTSTAILTRAALRAQALGEIRDHEARRTATALFQATLGILDRIAQNSGMPDDELAHAVSSLIAVETAPEGYGARIAAWLRTDLSDRRALAAADAPDPLEDGLLLRMAGPATASAGAAADAPVVKPELRTVQWEGRAYRVDPTAAEHQRLHRVRQRQGGSTLDAALEATEEPSSASGAHVAGKAAGRDARIRAERALADTLTSILYAAYLGEPDGAALSGGNVAARHDFALTPTMPPRPVGAWRLPVEEFRARSGWRVTGSLLGLDIALARLALRRLDAGTMPPESHLSTSERQTAALTVALLNPYRVTDAGRDEIAAALGRGRSRLAALGSNRDDVERVAVAAGLSEWRREALAWTLTQDPGRTPSALSLLELLWLGAPRPSAAAPLDPWGAATLPLTGCACLRMPHARAWEDLSGRPAQGLMATRAADVSLLAADALAARKLPASLAPGIVELAMQDALDAARPAYFDDWSGFTRAVAALPPTKIDDYIAALTAAGPLIAMPRTDRPSSRR
jgi:hypothetical protein